MADLEAYPSDMKVQTEEVVSKPSVAGFSKMKGVACAVAALYCTAVAGYWTAQHIGVPYSMSHGHGMKDHRLPHYSPHQPFRADITEDRAGVPLLLEFAIIDKSTHEPVPDMIMSLWHADAEGSYSGIPRQPHKPSRKGPHGKHPNPTHPRKGDGHRNEAGEEVSETIHEVEHRRHDSDHAEKPRETDERRHGSGMHPAKKDKESGCDRGMRETAATEKQSVESHWLRGVQQTNEEGHIFFSTIFPGFDGGKPSHIHYILHPARSKNDDDEGASEHLQPNNKVLESHPKHGRGHGRSARHKNAGELVFDRDLVSQVFTLPAYAVSANRTAERKRMSKHTNPHEIKITEIEQVDDNLLEAGLRAKLTILVDVPSHQV